MKVSEIRVPVRHDILVVMNQYDWQVGMVNTSRQRQVNLKPGYIEFGVVCIDSAIGIQLLLRNLQPSSKNALEPLNGVYYNASHYSIQFLRSFDNYLGPFTQRI